VAGRTVLKSWLQLNTVMIKFKRLLQRSSAWRILVWLTPFSGVWDFLRCWENISGQREKRNGRHLTTGVTQQFLFVSVKGRIWGDENTGVCSGRQEECLARWQPYGIRTKHILDLVHLIPLCVKDTLGSKAKKYNFDYYCFQTCRDFSK